MRSVVRYTRTVARLNPGVASVNGKPVRSARQRQPTHPEHLLQTACVADFRQGVRPDQAIFVAIPNGDARDAIVQERLKEEGLYPGALDGILVLPKGRVVWVEFKTEKDPIRGTQRTYPNKNQRDFMAILAALGHVADVIRTREGWHALLKREGVKSIVTLWR